MEIWLDTANLSLIEQASKMGILHGVTTNPSIVAKSNLSLEDLLQKIFSLQSGPVTAQVTALNAEEMIRQGKNLHKFSDQIIIKVPTTAEGLKAMRALSQAQIPVMATAIFDINQVLLAAHAKANYIAPYFSRICEDDMNGVNILKGMLSLLSRYSFSSKLIAASLHTAEQVRECCEMGVHAVTLTDKVFCEIIGDHPQTVKSVNKFAKDWKEAKKNKTLEF